MKKYNIIYADPPWQYADKGCSGAAELHYSSMTKQAICDLPVGNIADKDCVLFLWATYPQMETALNVVSAWGFKYKSIAFQWVKTCPRDRSKFFLGLGRWTRGNTEPCLIATKGSPHRISASVSQLVIEPLRRHSEKPDCVRDKILELVGDLPRAELFARKKVKGWDCFGDEVDSDIVFGS